MRYRALACDYDGTLATAGQIDAETTAALTRLRESGRRLLMVTGRELDELLHLCPQVELFDSIVAENGALLYEPNTRREKLLAEPPPAPFVEMLRQRAVTPLSVGRGIVATLQPYDTVAHDTIRDLGLELQVILNKGAVMILPAGVNKATGLARALEIAQLSLRNTVAIGDAENDHAMLAAAEFGVAVANALPAVRERADLVTSGGFGAGVQELIDLMLRDDLASLEERVVRRRILCGQDERGEDVCVSPYGESVSIAADSAGSWPEAATRLCARLHDEGYQYCAISIAGAPRCEATVVLGGRDHVPSTDEIVKTLETPSTHVAVDLACVALDQRGRVIDELLRGLARLRARTSRPHWIVTPGLADAASVAALLHDEPTLDGGVGWLASESSFAPPARRRVVRSASPESQHCGRGARRATSIAEHTP